LTTNFGWVIEQKSLPFVFLVKASQLFRVKPDANPLTLTLFGRNTFRHCRGPSESTNPVWTVDPIEASSTAWLARQPENDDSDDAVETC
jgi:hypothetical protein